MNNLFLGDKIKFEYKLAIIYLLLGFGWILYSDRLVSSFTDDPLLMTEIQHYKGWFYVLATAILLFLLTKKHLTRIRRAEALAKQNDRLKTAFVQNISHELRTPMNSIIGFSELAQFESTENEMVNSYLDVILDSSKQLLIVINDVLDTSLLETGVMKVNLTKIRLRGFLDSFFYTFAPLMNPKVTMIASMDTIDDDFYFVCDEDKLRRVVSNLLSNAIKFTHSGSIELGCSKSVDELQFYVKDTGVGLEANLHESVFERFSQAESTIKNCIGGTGLGLSICKEMIGLFNGKIWVESELNKGSNFKFTVPLVNTDK
ncbi:MULTISPECIES: sensor histidine kinase [unclassified Saccharicrinis]|uniref:sensor histidine kinase n=1 Tax=unclassified Saccharicrinis TaxID=2646859 RepID=UPI003D33DD23